MSEDIRDDTWRKVTSVGNSWIVCKSKSHSGHVYYFNTLTGEAVWNLSDAEIERAKNTTKHLEHVPGAKPTKCPEPKDKPPSTLLNNSQIAHRAFHEPSINNKVSEQLSSGSTFSNNATFSNINQIAALMQTHFDNPSSVESVTKTNPFNNPISTFNLNTNSPSMYNPKCWAVSQPQQVFIGPQISAIDNHSPASPNLAYNNLTQTLSQPISGLALNSCGNANQPEIITSGTRTFGPNHHNYGQSAQRNLFATNNDLRQKLSARKRLNSSSGVYGGSCINKTTQRRADISAHIASIIEETNLNDDNRSVEKQLHESPTRIDLGPLKSLAPPDCNSDAWFVVVDLEVLLNEFKFLNSLTDSDEQCHLMVPKRVMDKLKTYVSSTENIQARRILRFLSQEIEIGYAFMAEEPREVKGKSMVEVILATCTQLSEINYHLILLSNDSELLSYKDSSSIKMFSINEVKKLLMDNPNKRLLPPVYKKPIMIDQLINKIKITVPNNTTENIDSPVRNVQVDEHFEDTPITDLEPKQNKTVDKIGESIVFKRTVDAGVQTNFEDINASTQLSNETENRDLNLISNSSHNNNGRITKSPVHSVLNVPHNKKREIKLKFRTSNQAPGLVVETEKKRFKWHRRRTTTQVMENKQSYKNQNTSTKEVESLPTNVLNAEISKQPDTIMSNKNPTRNENNILEDSIGSKESSIYADQKNISTKENVTIEETSTSGIISNTESNVDAESSYSNSTVNQQQSNDNELSKSKVMYEIDSTSMSEYLKVKCDEWISRYIQIMEEVLSQVLQQYPSFSHSAMPPPWTLHEAAQCVAIKFSAHQDIKRAADKLSNILYYVSDAKGKITMNMTPHQYMQMYSYGVHLLSAIMKVTNNFEDMQIAVDSLKKLLDDIRNPNMDSSTNDTFNDNDQNLSHSQSSDGDESQNNTTDLPDNFHNSPLQKQASDHDETDEGQDIVQEPKKRKFLDNELQKPVKFIRNIDINKSSFFENLHLKRVNAMKNNLNGMQNSAKSNYGSHEEPNYTQTSDGSNSQNTLEKGTSRSVPSSQPTIIRNFSICPQLEAKLKRNYNSKVNEDHDDVNEDFDDVNEDHHDINEDQDDDLNYNEDYNEYITEEFCSEDESYNVTHNNVDINATDVAKHTTNEAKVVDSLKNNENSKKFKYVMCTLLQEVRKALSQVRILCNQCYELLKKPEQSTEQKSQLRKMLERAHLHIIRLCRSLESMLDDEMNKENVCNLLRQADINTSKVDDRLLLQYRISVAKCKDHADEFLNTIQNIISAFNG